MWRMTGNSMSRTFSGTALFVLVLFSSVLPAQTHAAKEVTGELRLSPSQIVNGVPDAISFVFVNLGDHEVRVPPVSPCIGIYTGRLKLRLQFSPVTPTGTGKGGGCGSGEPHMPILDQVKSWRRLQPGQSFRPQPTNELSCSCSSKLPETMISGASMSHLRLQRKRWLQSNMQESIFSANP